jgi:hypothetical protein
LLFSTIFSKLFTSSDCAITWWTSPIAWASSASMSGSSKIIRCAWAMPTMRGSRHERPPSTGRPTRPYPARNFASGSAQRMSPRSASESPPPAAGPFTSVTMIAGDCASVLST